MADDLAECRPLLQKSAMDEWPVNRRPNCTLHRVGSAEIMSIYLTNIPIVNNIDNMKARAESLEQMIWQLRRAFRDLMAAADRELQVLGVRAGDRAFLEFLAREPKPISLSDLAKKYSVSRQHIHQALRRLPHPEWVEESPDPTDRRAVVLRLSRKGRSCWRKIRDIDRAFLKRLAGRLPEDRVVAATAILRQLRSELSHGKEPKDE